MYIFKNLELFLVILRVTSVEVFLNLLPYMNSQGVSPEDHRLVKIFQSHAHRVFVPLAREYSVVDVLHLEVL